MANLLRKGISFLDVLNMWVKTKTDIKIQSRQRYEQIIERYITGSLANKPAKKITQNDIILYFNGLNEQQVSISVQKTLRYIIKAALKMASKKKLCKNIDLTDLKIKKNVKTIYILPKEDQVKLETVLHNKPNIRKGCLLLALYTGLRIGEICGLKWGDIDFINKTVTVNRTIERIYNENPDIKSKTILIESTPKSETSIRTIPISNFIIDYLLLYKGSNEDFILSNSQTLYDPRQFRSFFKRIMKNSNIKYINFHTLRHTFATRSLESKMDFKTLSEILGHSSIDITINLYAHPSVEFKKSSIENLVEYMMA